MKDADTGFLSLAIINSGRGTARGCGFAVHALGRISEGPIGDGFLRPGAKVHCVTSIGPLPAFSGMQTNLPDLAVMVSYRDSSGFVHYRTHKDIEYVPRTAIRRRPKYLNRSDVFQRLYPHVDMDSAEFARHNVVVARGA